MSVASFIVPLGIAGYSCLFLAVLSGLLMFKFRVRWIKLAWHIRIGFLALILATLHAGIVVFSR